MLGIAAVSVPAAGAWVLGTNPGSLWLLQHGRVSEVTGGHATPKLGLFQLLDLYGFLELGRGPWHHWFLRARTPCLD